MSKRSISFAISFVFLSLNSISSAQTSFFTPTLSDYKSSGWTLSLGVSGLGGSHSEFEDEILLANPSSASIDTVYSGTWTPDGGIHLTDVLAIAMHDHDSFFNAPDHQQALDLT